MNPLAALELADIARASYETDETPPEGLIDCAVAFGASRDAIEEARRDLRRIVAALIDATITAEDEGSRLASIAGVRADVLQAYCSEPTDGLGLAAARVAAHTHGGDRVVGHESWDWFAAQSALWCCLGDGTSEQDDLDRAVELQWRPEEGYEVI